MRAEIIGFFGAGELCDDLCLHMIRETFNSLCDDIKWHPRDDKGLDLLILGGGSLLGGSLSLLKNGLEKSSCVFCIFGTGFRETNLKAFTRSGLENMKYTWNRADIIAVRGKTSVERLDKLGFDVSKISALGDPVFLLEGKKAEKEYVGGVIRPQPYNLNHELMKQRFEFLRSEIGQKVRLFSFCDHQGDMIGEELGFRTQSLLENYSEKALIRGDPSFRKVMEDSCAAVYRSSFWLGNRLHPFCVALINSVPTIGVEIEFRKVEDVCSTLNYPYWIRADAPIEEFKEMYYKLTDNWEKVNEDVQKKITEIKKDLRELAQRTVDIVHAAHGGA